MKLVAQSSGAELEDAKTLNDLQIQDSEVVGLCYKVEGAEGAAPQRDQSLAACESFPPRAPFWSSMS